MTKLNRIRLVLGLIGAAGILAGIMLGQPQDTLRKAIRICLECIGIG